ncbi:tetratricopeptide repeat protein [Pseudoxanthomonas suwonensis]|uniref:Cytochrome C biogenesis protein n=1 Tax=Pseudoxanthomonas suwonensis TaxID=314722 RepID=A0A0E3Z1B8_9GAMM|nr:tetratricopeptide repeat protein [Pseudoxanthomonas suwonensis]AKC85558.1 cytochrome C biogenesis protein [Pseudoxanthomonas suwonensis]
MVSATAVFAALAAAVTLAVLAWVLWPLRGGRRWPWAGAVLVLAVGVLALYRLVGTPAALQETAGAAPQSLEQAVARLQAELERNPAQPEGWALLARSQAALGDPAAARDAYARAVQLAPDEPALLVDAAEARALADPQRRFDAQAIAWLQRAQELDPAASRATWFLGVAQRQAGEHAEAARTWESLLGSVDAATARSLRVQIDAARADAGLPPLPAGEAAPAAPASANALTVKVSLDPDFAERVRLRGDATVFVIARLPDGPPMPVAVERHALRDLPLQVVLDDADSPMPTQKLSALQEVEVLARVSADGSANRGEGDLESPAVRVALPAAGPVELVIGAGTDPAR